MHAWITGRATGNNDVVFRTSDGGHSWQKTLVRVTGAHTHAPYFAGVSRLNRRRGWLSTVDVGMHEVIQSIYETNDGGAHWKWVRPAKHTSPISGILKFQTPKVGYAANAYAGSGPDVVYRSVDGGRSWKSFRLPMPSMYRHVHTAVAFSSVQTMGNRTVTLPAVIEPLDLGSHHSLIVYRSDDAGRHWVRGAALNLGAPDSSASVAFANAQDGWVLTSGRLYRTQDAGEIWAEVSTRTNLRRGFGLDFVNAQVGFCLVWNGTSQTLMKSTDAGRTWRNARS